MRTVILRDRLAALTPRERVFLLVGVGALLVFLLWFLLWRGADESEPVLLTDSAPPALSAPAAIQPPLAPPPALPVVTAPSVPAAPVQGSAATLTLQGVSGGGPGGGAALIQYQTGSQRLVRVGREIVPGMMLTSVGPTYAIANSGGSELRLELSRPGATPVAAGSGPAPATVQSGALAEKRETMDLRLGLEPVITAGRTSGYRVKPGAGLARLGQAGLQAGDVITGVNGSQLNEERLLELSWQMSNSERMDMEVVRGGRKMKLSFVPQQLR